MNGSLKLFRVFGIDVKLHYSWWFIFFLLTWSLATSFFPIYFSGFSTEMYWLMGVISAILLFISVLLHELSHSLVAKATKIPVESITLFFFGGVAGITKEDMKPKVEFMMAIAGPLFSLVLAGLFFVINRLDINALLTAITFYLYQINFILAVFNLIPGFPLDGGRAFRALLYAYFKDLRKATKIAVAGGKAFAGVLIFLGILSIFTAAGGGIWFILLGGFLYFIAGMSYEQVVLKDVLAKIPVMELKTSLPSVKPAMKLVDFMKKYPNKNSTLFMVKDKNFTGFVDLQALPLMQFQKPDIVLKDVAVSLSASPTLEKTNTAYTALQKFSRFPYDFLPIMDRKRFVGVVTRQTLNTRLTWELTFTEKGMRQKIRRI